MRLTDHDRKLLWGRAANRCAKCRTELIVGRTVADRDSIVGDEAHIVSASAMGPRGDVGGRSKLDSYENAILLCKTDHKMVDDQTNTYTAKVLRQLKRDHESCPATATSRSGSC